MKWAYDSILSLCIVVTFCLLPLTIYFIIVGRMSESENSRVRDKYFKEHCIVSGYYGRSGEYKIYNCSGRIIKE